MGNYYCTILIVKLSRIKKYECATTVLLLYYYCTTTVLLLYYCTIAVPVTFQQLM